MAPPTPNNVSYSMELVLHSSDLLGDILLISICKEWLSLISSTEFGQKHTIRFPKVQQSLLIHTGARPKLFHLNPTSRRLTSFRPTFPDDYGHTILQSSNGLLLLIPAYIHPIRDKYLYVHNPITKQSRKIFHTPSTAHPLVAYAALAYDPSKSPYYELVCIRRSPNRVEPVTHRIDVYSSKSHTWNKELILEPFTLPSITGSKSIECSSPVYWNNVIYWSSEAKPYWSPGIGFLYHCFDVTKREMKTLPFPAQSRNEKGRWVLQESNGHLFHVESIGESVAVWELLDDDHWLLRHHGVLPPPPPWVAAKCRHPRMLTFFVDTCSWLICWNGWMRFYSLDFGSYEDFLDATGHPFFRRGSQYYLRLTAFEFRETLAPV